MWTFRECHKFVEILFIGKRGFASGQLIWYFHGEVDEFNDPILMLYKVNQNHDASFQARLKAFIRLCVAHGEMFSCSFRHGMNTTCRHFQFNLVKMISATMATMTKIAAACSTVLAGNFVIWSLSYTQPLWVVLCRHCCCCCCCLFPCFLSSTVTSSLDVS